MKELIGKTIKDIKKIGDFTHYSDDGRATEIHEITCSDGKKLYLSADGGDCEHYCTMILEEDKTTAKSLENIFFDDEE